MVTATMQSQKLSLQIKVQESQIKVVKSFYNNEIKIGQAVVQIIELQDQSPIAESSACFIEWITDQLQNNDLPEMSSGSFITALGDIDPFYEMEEFDLLTADEINIISKE